MKKLKYLLFFLFAYIMAFAQSDTRYIDDKPCNLCINGEHHHAPPYDLRLKKELGFFITAPLVLTLGLVANVTNDFKVLTPQDLKALDPSKVNSFDRSAIGNFSPKAARASDYLRTGVLVLPVLFLANHHTKKDINSLFLMSAEVFITNFGLTSIVKNIVQRKRPFVYNTSLSYEERTTKSSRLSFFSGHASITAAASFFIAKVMSDYHPNMKRGLKWGIWIVSASIPAITSYLRVRAGKHFPTDVIAGYGVGALTGWIIPELHKHSKKLDKTSFNVFPVQGGMAGSFSFKF